MASVVDEARAVNPVDVSDIALYVEDKWRAPFARLRADMAKWETLVKAAGITPQ